MMSYFPQLETIDTHIPIDQKYGNLFALLQAIQTAASCDKLYQYAEAARDLLIADNNCCFLFYHYDVSETDEKAVNSHVSAVLTKYESAIENLPKYGGYLGVLLCGVYEQLNETFVLLSALLYPAEAAVDVTE